MVDSHQRPLFCPWVELRASELGDRRQYTPAKVQATWNLFLRSDFGADDWMLISPTLRSDPIAQFDSLARKAALGALATLLIVVMLSLIQVRRTMVPLEWLLVGTRRLSSRGYSVRVRHDRDDKFAELSRTFSRMAERIGAQVESMQVQSSIDREILSGLDVARILQQVARRLAQLVPHAEVAVVELDRGSRMLARAHFVDGTFVIVSLSRIEALCSGEPSHGGTVLLGDPPR